MSTDPIAALEYESIIFARHRNQYTGQAGTNAGVLDSSGYNLLTLLQLRGPSTIGELSAITGLDASTLNRQSKALLTKGFVERIPDPDGGIARKFHPPTSAMNWSTRNAHPAKKNMPSYFQTGPKRIYAPSSNFLKN